MNVSNLSDLVPDEPSCSEKLNETDEDTAGQNNRFRGELNEVAEVDEDVSDDAFATNSDNAIGMENAAGGTAKSENDQLTINTINQIGNEEISPDKINRAGGGGR